MSLADDFHLPISSILQYELKPLLACLLWDGTGVCAHFRNSTQVYPPLTLMRSATTSYILKQSAQMQVTPVQADLRRQHMLRTQRALPHVMIQRQKLVHVIEGKAFSLNSVECEVRLQLHSLVWQWTKTKWCRPEFHISF